MWAHKHKHGTHLASVHEQVEGHMEIIKSLQKVTYIMDIIYIHRWWKQCCLRKHSHLSPVVVRGDGANLMYKWRPRRPIWPYLVICRQPTEQHLKSCTGGDRGRDPSLPAGRRDICGVEHRETDSGHYLDRINISVPVLGNTRGQYLQCRGEMSPEAEEIVRERHFKILK